MLNEDDLQLCEVEQLVGHQIATTVVVKILGELVRHVVVGKTMSSEQLKVCAEDILDMFSYFRLGELKRQIVRMRRTGKFYDRLDGNSILRELSEYDRGTRDDIIERYQVNVQKAKSVDVAEPDGETMSYDEYLDSIRQAAQNGDEEAAKALEVAEQNARLAEEGTGTLSIGKALWQGKV